jgi:hypothetical protein
MVDVLRVPLNGWASPQEQEQYQQRLEGLVETRVRDAAAVLDEHFPGWHKKVTQEIRMHSVHSCILGLVFSKQSRLPWRRDQHNCGYGRGYGALRARLGNEALSELAVAFATTEAKSHWETEIKRRTLC